MAHNIKWLFEINTDTGQILQARTVASLDALPEEDSVTDGKLIKYIRPEDIEANNWTSMARTVDTWHWTGSSWFHRGDKPSALYHFWSFSLNTWEYQSDTFLAHTRQERNTRLLSCDWTQTNDSPLTEEKKTEWRTYRQALRDFPSSLDLNLEPIDVQNLSWPTQPE